MAAVAAGEEAAVGAGVDVAEEEEDRLREVLSILDGYADIVLDRTLRL